MTLSPADFAVLAGGLRSVANEMGDVMMRAAHSTIIRESRDCSTCILDANGDTVAQAETIPIHMNSLGSAFERIRSLYDLAGVRPGEAFLMNNAYQNGQHLNDIILILSVFDGDELVGFVGTIAHHLEVGGAFAGSNANATEIFQEGLILPAMKIDLERDLYGGPIEQILTANVRCPDVVLGDLRAQISAALRGRNRLLDLCTRYGRDRLGLAMAALQDYSERAMRALISRIPDGEYLGEDCIDGFAAGEPLVPIRARVTIAGDQARVDLTGSADQVSWPVNVPVASTHSAVLTVFATMLGPDNVTNAGTRRPVEVLTREGSILDPRHPAPVRGRMTGAYRAATAIKRALGQAAPERVAACGSDSTCILTLSHRDGDRFSMFSEILNGGNGGASATDGAEAVAQMLSNTGNAPVEAVETAHPFVRVQAYCLLPDSGGAGEYRGGLGVRKRYEILVDDVLLSTNGDRQGSEPWGANGGAPGTRTRYTIERARGDGAVERVAVPAATVATLNRGDVFEMVLPGGGGWGDPSARSPERVADDLRTGRITPAAAERSYPRAFAAVRATDER